MSKNISNLARRALYWLSSLILFLSYALFFLLYNLNEKGQISITGQLLPIIIGSIISFSLLLYYHFWRTKEYQLIKIHMKKNYIMYDFAAVAMLSTLNILSYMISAPFVLIETVSSLTILGILIGFGVLTLIPLGFHLYFTYKVKITLIQRMKGNDIEKIEASPKIESTNKTKDDKSTAGRFYE